MTIPEVVGAILDVFLYAQSQFGGAGADNSFVAGPLSVPTDLMIFSGYLVYQLFQRNCSMLCR
jgi:hypothetical protein